MNPIYKYECYKLYLREHAAGLPNSGRGFFRQLSEALKVSSTMTSQVVNGDKHFSHENINDAAIFLGLTDYETDYLFVIYELSRASNVRYRNRLFSKLLKCQEYAQLMDSRFSYDDKLTAEGQAVYYSEAIYGLVRGLAILPSFKSVKDLAQSLRSEVSHVEDVIRFLENEGILKRSADGQRYEPGIAKTHLSSTSPLVLHHHRNWRFEALQRMEVSAQENLFFTAPMTLSHSVARAVRERLPDLIQGIVNEVADSESEVMYSLNVDWFRLDRVLQK